MIKLVVFDLDDTLYNERDFVIGAFLKVCDYLSIKYSVDKNILYKKCIEILDAEGRGKIFDELCRKFDFTEDVRELVSIYRNSRPKLKLYEDAESLLAQLKDKYKLGLITDGMASVQWNKIKALDIEAYFDKIIVTDDLGREYWKPNKFAFMSMLEAFDLKGNEAVYIGDNPHKDFIGAREAGFNTLRIMREVGDHSKVSLDQYYEADKKIYSLNEVIEYLEV